MKFAKSILMCLALLLVLSACSSNGNSTNSGSSSGSSGNTSSNESSKGTEPEKVTLRFTWWGGESRHEATIAAIEAYKKIAPHVTIEPEYQGYDGYEQKMKTQLASKNAADIIQIDPPWMPELAKNDFFVDLATNENIDTSTFSQEFINNFGLYDNQLIALPSGVNSAAMIVNQTLADSLGLDYTSRYDWEKLYEVGKAYHEADPSKYLVIADRNMFLSEVTSYIKQLTGVPWVNDDFTLGFTEEHALEAFTWLEKAVKAGVYQPSGEADIYFGKVEQNPLWVNQGAVFIPSMSSMINTFKSTLPEGVKVTTNLTTMLEDGEDSALWVRPSQLLSVNKDSSSVEEATKFLNWFLTSEEAAVILGEVRSVPASSAAQKAAVDAGKIDPVIISAVEQGLANAGITDVGVATNSEITSTFMDVVEKVTYGKISAADAAKESIENLNKKLAELKAR